MRVLIVSQYYQPENVPIPAAVARGLAARGHSVRVVTGYPNYPAGRLFEGYRMRGRRRERIDGVDVLRVPLFIDHSHSAVRRMANYVSFAIASACARGFSRRADVVYVYATQMTAAFGPWLARLLGGAPYVLHVQDLWPDSIVGSSLTGKRAGGILAALLRPWLRSVYRRAAGVVAIAPSMRERLVEAGAHDERTHTLFNWADERGAPGQARAGTRGADAHRAREMRTTTEVVFAGNIGDMQDLETAVRAAHRTADAGLRLTLVGGGVARDRVHRVAHEIGANNVVFRPAVPAEQMAEVYAGADFSLVTLKDLPAFRGTVPSKLQGSLLHGVPLITTVPGDVRHLVREFTVGLTADPEDVDALAAAFADACDMSEERRTAMAFRARECYEEHFASERTVSTLNELLIAARKAEAT